MRIFDGYRHKFYIYETDGPLKLHRGWIYTGKIKGNFSRLANYFSFVICAIIIGLIKIGRQDLIICESPPLFLGISALILSKTKKAKLVFNVSDLWPRSVEELGIVRNKTLLKGAYKLEKRIYSKSALITGQTRGIIDNIKIRFPGTETHWLPNGIDFNQFNINADGSDFRRKWKVPNDSFIVLYAGIFGYAQGLETVLQAAELLLDNQKIKFFLIGDGPEKQRIIDLALKKNLWNMEILPNMARNNIPEIISACNAYVVPLKKLDLFLGAIPSKIFEPLAMGKPVILGVDGEARELFIEQGKGGLYYEPEDYTALTRCVLMLEQERELAVNLGASGRKYVKENFDRARIAEELQRKLIRLYN
jgi:glycosyltransferase involved in cell wall biosynthesis